jgi:hypothetical protein
MTCPLTLYNLLWHSRVRPKHCAQEYHKRPAGKFTLRGRPPRQHQLRAEHRKRTLRNQHKQNRHGGIDRWRLLGAPFRPGPGIAQQQSQ